MRKNSNRRLRREVRGLKAEIGELKTELEELRSEAYDEPCDACESDYTITCIVAVLVSVLIVVSVVHYFSWNGMNLGRLKNDFMSLCGIVRVAAEPKEDDDGVSWERLLRGDQNIYSAIWLKGCRTVAEVYSSDSEDSKETSCGSAEDSSNRRNGAVELSREDLLFLEACMMFGADYERKMIETRD